MASSTAGAVQYQAKELASLLTNNRVSGQAERFYFLPGTLTLPNLVVDFQQLATLSCGGLDNLKRSASLDSPFAETLLARFTCYFGRLGTPDFEVEAVVSRLQSAVDKNEG